MGKYLDGVKNFYNGIARAAADQQDPRKRAILLNYLHHAALEYTDRWEEIFVPERTIDDPVYKVRWGTPEEVVYDGIASVKDFYRALKNGMLLSNQNQLLAVADWGFSSFLEIVLYMDAEKARAAGHDAKDSDAQYALITPCAMYWTYDDRVRLIGEYVYEIGPGRFETVIPEDRVTFEDLQAIVAPHLPPPGSHAVSAR